MQLHNQKHRQLQGAPRRVRGRSGRVRAVQPAAMGRDLTRDHGHGEVPGVVGAAPPTGCFITGCRLLGATGCSTSPVTRRHSSANQLGGGRSAEMA